MGWKPFKVILLVCFFFYCLSISALCTSLTSNICWSLQITYTSDYFQELYELAVELIQRGHAYVDHQVASNFLTFESI
jgi:hypothetical protein